MEQDCVLVAGSEKTKTDMVSTAEQQTESHNINKSLLVLGQSLATAAGVRPPFAFNFFLPLYKKSHFLKLIIV